MTDVKLPEAGVPTVDSHVFMPRDPMEPWGLCRCGMAQAAHAHPGAAYVSDTPRRHPVPVLGSRPPAEVRCPACHDTRYFSDNDGHGGFTWKRQCNYCRP